MRKPLMPKATACWLIDNTSLSFKQISEFVGIHALEIQAIADGEVSSGILPRNPLENGELTKEEYHYKMRMFYPHEIDIILSESGFIIKDKMGDYDGSPIDEESGMQIYVCES